MKKKQRRKPKQSTKENIGPPLYRSYHKRNETVQAIGFKNYTAYLKSVLWDEIRSAVLEESPLCIRCQCEANQVHHADYKLETLTGEKRSRLFPICCDCHYKAEHDHNGRKTTTGRANRFLGLDSRNGWPVIRRQCCKLSISSTNPTEGMSRDR